MKKFKTLLIQTLKSWQKDGALTQGAAVSFYTITALPVLIIGLLAIASFFLDKTEVQDQLILSFSLLFGDKGVEVIRQILNNVPNNKTLTLTTLLSFLFLLVSVSGIFEQLQTALNRIWKVAPKPKQGLKRFFLNQAVLFFLFLLLGVLLVLSIIFESAFTLGSDFLSYFVTLPFDLLTSVSLVTSFVLLMIIFTLLLRFLPDGQISWHDSLIGASFTTILFTIGKFLIGFYLAHTTVASTFGATGSVILLLLWIYYSAQVFFLGAEFTHNFAHLYGAKIKPSPHAYRTTSWWSKIRYRSS